MLHTRIHLSPTYWCYAAAARLSVSRLGTWFFKCTRSFGEKKLHSGPGKTWWRFYLFNVITHHDKEELLKNAGTPIKLRWMQEYDFAYWNAFFHMSCLSHTLFELARGNRPILMDKEHVWEQFFELPIDAPDGVDADTLPENDDVKAIFMTSKFAPHSKTVTRAWSKLMSEFVTFNAPTREYMQAEETEILTDPAKTLGVICRGTDYISLAPPTHPKQPKLDEVIALVRQWMNKYGYEKIYLATEEQKTFERFEKEFPGRVLTNKRTYYDKIIQEQSLETISRVHFDRENDDYLKGLEYMSSLNLLSKCDALVGGNCGGTLIATFMNNGRYTRTHVFDRGLY